MNEVDIFDFLQLGSCAMCDLLGLERQEIALFDHIEAAVTWLCVVQDQPKDGAWL